MGKGMEFKWTHQTSSRTILLNPYKPELLQLELSDLLMIAQLGSEDKRMQ